MAPPLPELMEELVEEVLLRFPPDDPASLVRAALASKQWCRLIISGGGGGFSRRFREFHRSPPLLGYLCNRFHAGSRFVPASPSFRPPNADHHGLRAVHSGHGRVLLHHAQWENKGIVVWDPITDEQRELPMGAVCSHPPRRSWNAAVLCAAGDRCCDHLGCHGDPFLVVFVGADAGKTFSCVYSSETDAWSKPIYAQGHSKFELGNSVLLGSKLYFKTFMGVLKYDLLTQKMSPIRLPAEGAQTQRTVLMATEDGRLGFAMVHEFKNRLDLWSREPNEGKWAQDRVIGLGKLRVGAVSEAQVAGFADNGAGGVVFIRTGAGFFTIDLKSGKSKKVGESVGFGQIVVPYVSFCTPAMKAASATVGPSAGVSSARRTQAGPVTQAGLAVGSRS